MPLAVIVAGYLTEGMGLRPTIMAVGICCYVVATFSMLVNPAIREMDRPASDGSAVR